MVAVLLIMTLGKKQPWYKLAEEGTEWPASEAFKNRYCSSCSDGDCSLGQWVDFFCNFCEVRQTWKVSHRAMKGSVFLPLLVPWAAITGHLHCFLAVSAAHSMWRSWNWDTVSCWADGCICWYCFWREGYIKLIVEPYLAECNSVKVRGTMGLRYMTSV